MLIHVGFKTPTEEIMKEWGEWFNSLGEKMIDHGSRFGEGFEVKGDSAEKLGYELDAFTGYTIIEAENKEDAIKIAKSCPSITAIRVYELMD